MNSLQNITANFKIPAVTPEQQAEAEAFDAMQRDARYFERIQRSGIPKSYRHAEIARCSREIGDYAASFSAQTTDGLLLTGKFGRGKTYQACAILEMAARICPVRFATMQGMLNAVKATFTNSESQSDVIAAYSNVRLLCIDDLGKEQATEWAAPIIYEIIDARYSRGKPTIITTNYNSASLAAHFSKYADAETAGAIISRICGMCAPVRIDGPDRRISTVCKG